MKGKHSVREIIITTASILLCLTLISTYLTAGMFARYVSSDSASDSARVATFNVDESGALVTSFAAEFIPNVPSYKDILIQNKSEVAISYTITIRNETNNMNLSFRCGKDKNNLEPMTPTEDGFSYTVHFEPNAVGQQYVLEILWNAPNSNIALQYMGAVDLVTVTLVASQVD
ncbi:MAG: hypothetical protein IKV39_05290 [Clostridia bacterium]|nr:hypothetical protein [Clostridia bacterium]